jgi:CshA-type fibril repeat protein
VTEDTSTGPVNVLGNDTDVENDPLTIASAAIDTNGDGNPDPLTLGTPTLIKDGSGHPIGTITVARNGNVTFVPALNYNGPVPNLTYVPNDGSANGTSATVSFGPIVPVNDAPVAVNDGATTLEDTPVTIAVLANDSDVDNPLDPSSVVITSVPAGAILSADGKTLTIPGQGKWVVNPSGTITFSPAANFNGKPTPISYTVKDISGAVSAPATVAVTVTSVNDGPVAVSEKSATESGKPVQLNLLGNDYDVDGDKITVVSASVPASQGVIANKNGVWTFTAAPNFLGVATISYTIKDTQGATSTSTHKVNVTAPSLVTTSAIHSAAFGSHITGSVADNDRVTAGSKFSILTPPRVGKMIMQPNGKFTFAPPADFSGSLTFTYRVTDIYGRSVTQVETLRVLSKRHSCLVTFAK